MKTKTKKQKKGSDECWGCEETIEKNQLYFEVWVGMNDKRVMIWHKLCNRCMTLRSGGKMEDLEAIAECLFRA